jgi:palmitoyltransferase ZDHHC9/14/18
MSSQRLQAQRSGRLATNPSPAPSNDSVNTDDGNNPHRQSITSNPTIRQSILVQPDDLQPPPSRGTEVTEREYREGIDRWTANTSPTGHGTTQSMTDSVRPLQKRSSNKGLTIEVNKPYKNGSGMPTPSKSPRSFRSSFLLPSRGGGGGGGGGESAKNDTQGREKLSSAATSPRSLPSKFVKDDIKPSKLGKNYQYFPGNTVFCLGGRLQNTRHNPINIATALLVLVPSGLFFGFSSVKSNAFFCTSFANL